MPNSELQVKRVAVARAHRSGIPEQLLETRRDLAAAKLEDYVARVVEAAPPLTDEQRQRIAALLAPTGGARA